MDKYDTSHDRYCYPDSTVLINKLNIKDQEELEQAERDFTAFSIKAIEYRPPPYDLAYMQFLHKKLFSELYDWAGHLRTIDISKGGTRFCTATRIKTESAKLFIVLERENWLQGLSIEDFCKKLAAFYCEINMIHPFREGNGRVQRLLFEQLALSAGYDLDWQDITPEEWVRANILGVYVRYEAMESIFRRIVVPFNLQA